MAKNSHRKIGCLILAIISLFIVSTVAPQRVFASSGEAQLEYAAGVMDFQKANYRSAAAHFKASIEKAPNVPSHALRRLYLAHCYAGLKDNAKAIELYQECINNAFGSPEAKFAQECIDKLKPKSGPSTTPAKSLSTGLMQRITVLNPKFNHPPVSSEFVGMIKSTISTLPGDLYRIIDQGGCTITIGSNITDKWPDAYNESAPGKEYMKLSQDYGRTYGMDIYMWERPLLSGEKRELGKPHDIDMSRHTFIVQLGHVVCEVAHVNEDKDFLIEYKKDVAEIPADVKQSNRSVYFFLSQEKMGPGELAAEALENYISKDFRDDLKNQYFKRSYEWIRNKFRL